MVEHDNVVQVRAGKFSYRLCLPNSDTDHIQRQIASAGKPYELSMLQDILERTAAGDVVVDVGANVGNHTIFLAVAGRRVFAYEPNNLLAQAIVTAAEINSLSDSVSVHCMACGSERNRGSLELRSEGNLGMGRITSGEGQVIIDTLDSQEFPAPVRLLKIDVEGMESDVIIGASELISRDRPLLYVEAATPEETEVVFEALRPHRYVHLEVFNATATHLFAPEEKIESNRIFPATAASIFGRADQTETIESQKAKIETLARLEGETIASRKRYTEALTSLQADNSRLTAALHEYHRQLISARSQPIKQMKRKVVHRVLRHLASSTLPIPKKTRSRFQRSADKRDPKRGIPFDSIKSATGGAYSLGSHLSTNRMLPSVGDRRADGFHKDARPLLAPHVLDGLLRDESFEPYTSVRDGCRVSVIIPAYNAAIWIERSVKSALFQYSIGVEVIVVDDGSTDNSLEVLDRLAKTYENVRVIPLLRNFGCYYARNIGVINSVGEFITVLDSDDLMGPNRLSAQVAALDADPNAIASQCLQRRWTSDFMKDSSDLAYGENSLLWRREATKDIGYYDSVRFAGDTEFRLRLKRHYGPNSIIKVPEEGLFLRTVEGSLAMTSETSAYEHERGRLKARLSPSRQKYVDAFVDWHEKSDDLYVPFPITQRPFALPDHRQEASVSIGQKKIGSMASFPPRAGTLERVAKDILPQLDELVLYLNQYESIPDFCKDERIRVILGGEAAGDLRDNGKFYDLPQSDDAYIFTFDDDIVYPSDYVAKMIHYIEMFERSCVVGVHGVIFPDADFHKLGDRKVFAFPSEQRGRFVDLLGTGTTAWHSSALKACLNDFATKGACDLWFSRLAAENSVPLFSVPRRAGWLARLGDYQENLYREAVENPEGYFRIFREALEPTLSRKKVRAAAEQRLLEQFGPDAVRMCGISLSEPL